MYSTQTFPLRTIHLATFALIALLSVGVVNAAAPALPDDIDSALQNLISSGATSSTVKAKALDPSAVGLASKGRFDSQGRVMVNINLNGQQPLANVHSSVVSLGGAVSGESSKYRNGLICAYVPVSALTQLATKAGVMSLKLALPPITHNSVISGGAFAIHSDVVNGGGNRGGTTSIPVKVGVISNSFDTATSLGGFTTSTSAADDIASGDLPGVGNPDGDTTAMTPILDDTTPGDFQDDEGRAMCQIVHDVAPGAQLAFATANPDQATFASNIQALRTAGCDIIVDDVLYFEEPMFSDGVIAQAVDTVVNDGAFYFSSAGNEQGAGYTSTFTPISDATARAGMAGQNLKLSNVNTKFTDGGWHNFSTTPGKVDISQSFTIPAGGETLIVFQWNDPFDSMAHPVTTDYNILIFDQGGNFIKSFSGIDKNTTGGMGTNEALEEAIMVGGSQDTVYQIAITRRGASPATPKATQLRYFAFDLVFGTAVGATEYYQPTAPATYGHSSSANAFAVAAYVYDSAPSNPVAAPFTPAFENYTSQGPSTIYFDSTGAKLASPQVRQKPDIAAPDGGNTTFFFPGDDWEGDGLPNFFGTSAAAPHAAGTAALMLYKARSHMGTIDLAHMHTYLQKSPLAPHDLDPFSCTATATTTSGGKVIVTGTGTDLNASSQDPNFFNVSFVPGKTGETLTSVTVDLTHSGLSFDSTTTSGFPFTLGNLKSILANQITNNVPLNNGQFESLTLTFASGAFTSASSVHFGIDRDFVGQGGGNHGDYLSGAQISAVTTKGTGQGTFLNKLGAGFSILDGWGFIDAQKAVNQVP